MIKVDHRNDEVIWIARFKDNKVGFIKFRLGNLGYGIGRSLSSAIQDYNFNTNKMKLKKKASELTSQDIFKILNLRIPIKSSESGS